jgi:hypothetical protein
MVSVSATKLSVRIHRFALPGLTSVAANVVSNEDLGGANFTGVLGLACELVGGR